jgi:hypothetical protein
MTRTVCFEDHQFVVSDDPEGVIATAIGLIVNNHDAPRITRDLAPDGDGFAIDTIGAVFRADESADLPSPWDADPALDPTSTELWVLHRDPDRKHRVRRSTVIGGDELRTLVAQALALRGYPRP